MLLLSVFCFSQSNQWIKVTKKDYSLQSPAGWLIDSSKQMGTDLVFFSMPDNASDRFRENINVLVQNTTGMKIDLKKFTAISEAQIKTMAKDAKILESTTVNGPKGQYQKIIYTATQSGAPLKFEQYYFVTDSKAYVVTLTTEAAKFELYRETGEQVLNSFTLRK